MDKKRSFDEFAEAYDAWFFDNMNLLNSEVNLVAYFMKDAGDAFSVGCGSGLFESILKEILTFPFSTVSNHQTEWLRLPANAG